MGDCMPKEQYEYITNIQKDCLESTNMTEQEAWDFAFRCWQLGYMKPTKEQVGQIFNYAILYEINKKNENIFGSFFSMGHDQAVDYLYRLIIKNERDNECLECKRYHSKSCIGTINRGRETITEENRCAAFAKIKEGDK